MSKTKKGLTTRTLAILIATGLTVALTSVRGYATDPPTFNPTSTFPVREISGVSLGASISRTVVGRFNDNADFDCVILRGGVPEMVIDPTIVSASIAYPAGAATTDIAKLDPVLSGVDELLTVDTSGLVAWKRTSAGTFTSRAVGTSAWIGTDVIRTAAISGASRTDIVGYRDSDEKLVLLTDPDTAGWSESSFSVARPALDIVPFVRYANGTTWLALRTSLGILIYKPDGTYVTSFTGPNNGAIVAIDHDGVAYQSIAWAHSDGSDQVLEIIENDGDINGSLTLSDPITIECGTVAALAAADMNGSGDDDLVISHRDDFDLVVLLAEESYGLAGSYEIRMGPPQGDASGNVTWPAVFDFDNDGDPDVMFSNDEVSIHSIFRNSLEDETDLMPSISSIQYLYDRDITLPAMLKMSITDADPRPVDANYIEIVLWKKNPIGDETDADGDRYLVPLDPGAPATYTDIWVRLDVANGIGYLDGVYFWMTRYVEVDDQATGDPNLQAWPSLVNGFSSEESTDTSDPIVYLLSNPGTRSYGAVSTYDYEATGAPFEFDKYVTYGPKETSGTGSDTDPIPDYDDDDEPGGSGGFGG